MITKTFDIDPNVALSTLFDFLDQFDATVVSLVQHSEVPVPTITVSFPESQIDNWNDSWHHDPSKQIK